jgi:hypothetical protein
MQEENNMSIELEGKIFLVTKDATGNVVSKEELDGETMLKALLVTIEDALESYIPPELIESLPNNK